MQHEIKIGKSRDVNLYKKNPVEGLSKVERANMYVKFLLTVGRDKWFLAQYFDDKFCRMIDAMIDFSLLENGRKFKEIESIRFYECRGESKARTIIWKTKYKN